MFNFLKGSNLSETAQAAQKLGPARRWEGSPFGGLMTMERPAPIAWEPAPLPDLTEYEEVAKVLGFEPPQIRANKIEMKRREMIEFLLDKGYPMYGNDAVHRYMTKLAERDGKVFVWARLGNARPLSPYEEMRREIARDYSNTVQKEEHGQIVHRGYHRPVPIEMLKRATEIKKRFGDEAEFYVSDYAVVVPDPFIMVKRGECEHIVFGVWDEPTFGL